MREGGSGLREAPLPCPSSSHCKSHVKARPSRGTAPTPHCGLGTRCWKRGILTGNPTDLTPHSGVDGGGGPTSRGTGGSPQVLSVLQGELLLVGGQEGMGQRPGVHALRPAPLPAARCACEQGSSKKGQGKICKCSLCVEDSSCQGGW